MVEDYLLLFLKINDEGFSKIEIKGNSNVCIVLYCLLSRFFDG